MITQGFDVNELHCDKVHTDAIANLVDVRDVRVIERCCGCCLLLEAAHSISVAGELSREYFQRNFTMQPSVLGQIDLTHSTLAELLDNPVMGKGFSNHRVAPNSRE